MAIYANPSASLPSNVLQGYRFIVEVAGLGQMGFKSISGLSEEKEVIEYREGHYPTTMMKMPGLSSFANITCEKGVSLDSRVIQWASEAGNGAVVDTPATRPIGGAVVNLAIDTQAYHFASPFNTGISGNELAANLEPLKAVNSIQVGFGSHTMNSSGVRVPYRDLTIHVVERAGPSNIPASSRRSFVLHDAWPAILSYGDLDATTGEVLIETLELAHHGISYYVDGQLVA